MGKFLTGFLLPFLLFTAAFLNWSLISLVDLVVALLILFSTPKRRFHYGGGNLLLWFIFAFTPLVILSQVIFLIIWAIEGGEWRVADTWWVRLIGFMTVQFWRSPLVIYYLVIQLLVALIPFIEIHKNRVLLPLPTSFSESLPSVLERIGYHVKVAFCLLLPAIQLVAGISNSSWMSLPFFVCSCVGLVDWSLTSNFLGLFRWWRYLWVYAGFNICLLYVYQLPVGFPRMFNVIAEFLGLYKISATTEGMKICSVLFLIIFYIMVSCVKCDLEEMESIMSTREGLTEQLLPVKHSFFIRESRSGVRHTNVLLRGPVFRTFSINFFTYGFPVSLFALSYWSFHFASVCAFGLLVYVGYIIFAFPSLFRLHRLNGLLLVFILLWAVCTYIFNVAFSLLNLKLRKDMEIWEMVGFWHYSIPGLFIFAQFGLGILIALGNLVNNSVFLYISDDDPQSSTENSTDEDKEETKVLIVATIAWGIRKCSRPLMLVLIFLIAMKPGLIHAVYMIFFFMYLLSHHISKRIRQALILLCEVHFAMLYALQIDLISTSLEQKGSLSLEFLSQLGLVDGGSSWDFLEIAVLAGFCAVHNHGYEMLFSFSAVVQHTPYPPVGFSILKAGLSKSVLLSVYATPSTRNVIDDPSQPQERIIASYLSAVSQKFLSLYRSFGTYISFLTILVTVYMVRPNYVSFGYIFLLLFWITGRQLVEKTKRRLWYPLKAYAVVVFILLYSLSIFPRFKAWVSTRFDLYSNFGYKPDALLLENIWESLAVMIVMQLYSYERRQSKFRESEDPNSLQVGVLGFIQRLLIWHSQKILFVALFYASLSPISTFGFLYLLGLVICSFLPKASRIPSKSFLVYTGFLVTTEYLFQMWGKHAKMFPEQKHYDLSIILGFKVYKAGFWGLEAGLRDKVLVIAACTLQYNVFHWLDKMPSSLSDTDICEEPCPLFVSEDVLPVVSVPNAENAPSSDAEYLSDKKTEVKSNSSWPSFNPASHDVSSKSAGSESSTTRRHSFGYIWGSNKDSQKWNKKQVLSLRMERFEMQKASLKVYLKFWIENMFNLFGLEINMIALLLVSFSLLNAISILYIGSLAACILLGRPIIRKSWPIFVFLFASILLLEYFALWKNALPSSQHSPSENNLHCQDCLKISNEYFSYCRDCWLGLNVDDPRVLLSYFLVFMLSCFKLRADHFSRFSGVYTYREMISQRKNSFVWRDLSFETKSMWTLFDYLRVYCYCHLLDLVLALILITGTFEYDILHLGYLAFALIFFRMRFTILKKKNKIFMWLRVYNFAVIVLSLAYQSPFVGDANAGKCKTVDYIYEVIGFYKYDYGFRITSRSSLVEIIIFVLISLQSYMFSSQDFDYVFRYLEAEQVGAIVREQEKKAAWKTAQLQHIREAEEKKRQRNLQVEKMKAEMLNLQTQLNGINSTPARDISSPGSEGLRRRRTVSRNIDADIQNLENEEGTPRRQEPTVHVDSPSPFELHGSPTVFRSGSLPLHNYTLHSGESPTVYRTGSLSLLDYKMHSGESPFCEITELEEVAPGSPFIVSDKAKNDEGETTEHPMISAVQLLGDGVSQVQSIGNQAVTNLANYLNIPEEDSDTNEPSSLQDGNHIDIQNNSYMPYGRSASLQSVKSMSDNASLQIGKIFRYILSQMRSNNDVVCYCCFLLVFLWNFSLLSMVYLAALFLYALCVNTGPSYIFWVVVLMYTEVYILLQYLYQVIIQHCGFTVQSTSLLYELGFPTKRMKSSFVISLLPLFLVYLFTLIQSSITVKDSDWISSTEYGSLIGRSVNKNDNLLNCSWIERAKKILQGTINWTKMIIRNCTRYWKSLTQEAESPPYFVQLSMDVHLWPEDGIQPEKIESGINQLLRIVHDERCKESNPSICTCASSVKVQSIEKSSENPNVALAVLEVVFASPWTECTPRERYKSLTPAADVAKEIVIAQHACHAEEVGFPYPILSVIGGGKREVDLYAYMFGADLSVFFLVGMFYQSVIKNKSKFLEVYQLEDQFPKEFVFILMVIFFLIVLDRIIYLCSFATGRVVFYLFNLFLFTYSVTQYAWSLDHSQENAAGLALRAIYLTKAISLVLQAMQIRYGVPHKSTLYRQFLTSNVSRVDYLGYRLYRAVPFLYELRCVLDWSCTTTSLTMYDWLKLEDMNASLYLVKCDAVLNRAGHRTGDKQTKMTKFCNGICLFFILICVIWAPMLIYSSGNPTNIENPIKDASVQFDIKTKGGRLTLYESTLCEITSWTNIDNIDPHGYLDSYNENDIQLICCQADASNLWLVPDVIQRRFMMSLYNNTMDMKFSWILKRDRPKGKEVVRYDNYVDPSDLPTPSEVKDVLNGSSNSFRINNTYLRYFRVTGSGDVRPFEQEVSADLVLNKGSSKWWSFYDISLLNSSECGDLTGPMAIIVSEETPQGLLGETLSKFSIWGIYITFVLAVGRFIRLQCSDLRMRIPFENLPSCDRLIAICEDIYAARAEGELGVEEILYWTLVKIYRSPHMLLEYTKVD